LSGIFHQVCYTGTGTVLGGVVAGPLGAAVGGVVGKCHRRQCRRGHGGPDTPNIWPAGVHQRVRPLQ